MISDSTKKAAFLSFVILTISLFALFVALNNSKNTDVQTGNFVDKKFSDKVKSLNYPQIDKAIPKTDLKWDLSATNEYKFNYKQLRKTTSHTMAFSPNDRRKGGSRSNNVVTGQAALKTEGDNIARLVLTDLVAEISMVIQKESANLPRQKIPTIVRDGINDKGRSINGAYPQDLLFLTLPPLPDDPVSSNTTNNISLKIPFNANGSQLTLSGNASVTATGLVNCNGDTCIQLDYDMSFEKIKLPPEVRGQYFTNINGISRAFYSLDRHRLVDAVTALAIEMDYSIPRPESITAESGISDDNLPTSIGIKIKSDTLVEFKEKTNPGR